MDGIRTTRNMRRRRNRAHVATTLDLGRSNHCNPRSWYSASHDSSDSTMGSTGSEASTHNAVRHVDASDWVYTADAAYFETKLLAKETFSPTYAGGKGFRDFPTEERGLITVIVADTFSEDIMIKRIGGNWQKVETLTPNRKTQYNISVFKRKLMIQHK